MGRRTCWGCMWGGRERQVPAAHYGRFEKPGVEGILTACVDGLFGFPQAIGAVSPQTGIQRCIIHQTRNPTKFVPYKGIKKRVPGLKRVYAALAGEAARNGLGLSRDIGAPNTRKPTNPGMATGQPCPLILSIRKRPGVWFTRQMRPKGSTASCKK